MPNYDYIVFNCIEVRQPLGDFYVGAISCEDLTRIAYADVRRIREGLPRDVEEFSGIQRPLSEARVDELRQYVTTVDAAFPTSIILDIKSEDAEYDPKGLLRVRNAPNVAKIIDGQHRIAGLADYRGPAFQLNVTIFIDMAMEDQALLFATINLKQTKVNKSLAYDLYEFASARSPQKTAHSVAKLLNSRTDSPFYHRIKLLGTASGDREETLTQAGFVDRLLPMISDDPMRDRDALKRGHTLPAPSPSRSRDLIFRPLFGKDADAEIAKNVWNYFHAVRTKWPSAWGIVTPGVVLNRTTGLAALMKFLPFVYRSLNPDLTEIVPDGEFGRILKPVPLSDADFTKERYLPGSAGQGRLLNELLAGSGLGGAN